MSPITALAPKAGRAVHRNVDLIASFLLPLGILAAIMFVGGINGLNPHGTQTVLTSDLNNQYAQFYAYFDQAVKGDGSLFFTWRADLGMNYWPIVAYYLASPFGLLTLLGSDQRLPILLAGVMLLKIGTAGFCMSLLLRRFRTSKYRAVTVLFSTGYAMMAWSLVYAFNIMWLDALYLLPLVLLAMERLLSKGRIAPLALALAANFIIDFYTGAMIAIFSVLYFGARYFGVREKFERGDFLRTGGRFALAGILGGAVSAFFTLPTYLGGITQKTQMEAGGYLKPPVDPFRLILRFFGGTLDPASKSPDVAAGTLLLLLVPLFFTVTKIKRAERIAWGGVLLFLFLSCEIPQLYLLWHNGSWPNAFPFRFAFVITATMVLLAFRAWVGIDSMEQVKMLIGLGVFWFVILFIGRQYYGKTLLPGNVTRFNAAILIVGTTVLAFALWLRVRGRNAPVPARLGFLPTWLLTPKTGATLAVLVLGVDICGSALIVAGKKVGKQANATPFIDWYRKPSTDYSTALGSLTPDENEFFRAEGFDRTLRSYNDSLRFGNFGQTHFSSLASGKLHHTLNELGFQHYASDVYASHTGATLLTDALLAYKYYVSSSKTAILNPTADLNRAGVTLTKTYTTKPDDITKVWQIDDTLPVGFRLDPTMLADFQKPLPEKDAFGAQEQVFGMPGAFQSMCSGAPTVSGDGMTIKQSATGYQVTASPTSKSATLTWNCASPGDREVYVFAPEALTGSSTYTRIVGMGRPDPLPAKTCKIDATGKQKCGTPSPNDDPANKNYPSAYANGIQDLGEVQAGSFQVTVTTPFVTTTDKGKVYNLPADPIRGLDPTAVFGKISQLATGGVTDVKWTDSSLVATTTGTDASTVFFSVPSIPGWSVTVDGKSVKTSELLGSFVGVPVAAGTHRIEMTFLPPGLISGGAGSLIGLAAVGGVWWYQRRRDRAVPSSPQSAPTPETLEEANA